MRRLTSAAPAATALVALPTLALATLTGAILTGANLSGRTEHRCVDGLVTYGSYDVIDSSLGSK